MYIQGLQEHKCSKFLFKKNQETMKQKQVERAWCISVILPISREAEAGGPEAPSQFGQLISCLKKKKSRNISDQVAKKKQLEILKIQHIDIDI